MQQSTAVRTAPKPPEPSRMTLAAVVKGKQKRPKRVVLYGVEGVGKSTFGADAPKPIFIGPEDGTAHLDVERLPAVQTWQEAKDAIRLLINETHDYQTAVVDTLDWLEPLLWEFVCNRDGVKDIEAYGFGKGYVVALEEWRIFLAMLERLATVKGMNVVLIAHSWVKPFKNPEGEDYDRYEMKLERKASGLIREWAETVLFANHESHTYKTDPKAKRAKGISTGERKIYTVRCAAYDAKNRSNLPDELALSWTEFAEACDAGGPNAAALRLEIERKAKAAGADWEKFAAAGLARAGEDIEKLTVLNNLINVKAGAAGQGE